MATLPDGESVSLQFEEGWNTSITSATSISKIFTEAWDAQILLSSDLTIGVDTQTIKEGETVTVSGKSVRSDGNAADSTLYQTKPDGTVVTHSPSIGSNGDYSIDLTLTDKGDHEFQMRNDLGVFVLTEAWDTSITSVENISLQKEEGWNS